MKKNMRNRRLFILLAAAVAVLPSPAAHAQGTPEQQLAEHRARAKQYLINKEPDKAIPELQAMEALDPNDADVHGNLGVLYYFRGDCARAVPELRKAVELVPGIWRQQTLLGFCEERLGDRENATKDLESAFPHIDDPKLNRDTGDALLRIYAANNDLAKAAAVMAVLQEKNPTDVKLLYSAYQLYSDLAGEAMISLSLVNPDSAEMHRLMAHESIRYGDRITAISHLREALKIDPKMPGLHEELADALNSSQEGGNKVEAEQQYKLALEENPKDELSQCRLGEMAEARGETQNAFEDYSKALQLRPEDDVAAMGMAKVYMTEKQPDKAAALLEEVVKRDPTNDVAHFRLSTAYRQLHRYDDAKKQLVEYQKYKEMKDKLRKIYLNLRLHNNQMEESAAEDEKK